MTARPVVVSEPSIVVPARLLPRLAVVLRRGVEALARVDGVDDLGEELGGLVHLIITSSSAFPPNVNIPLDSQAVDQPVSVETEASRVDAATAAKIRGVSQHRIRQLRNELDGRKVAGRWTFDAAKVRAR